MPKDKPVSIFRSASSFAIRCVRMSFSSYVPGRALEVAAIWVQVAPAEGGGGDAEDGVGWLLDAGHRTVFHGNLWDSVANESWL